MYYMLDNNIGTEDIIVNQNRVPALMERTFLWGEKSEKQQVKVDLGGLVPCHFVYIYDF